MSLRNKSEARNRFIETYTRMFLDRGLSLRLSLVRTACSESYLATISILQTSNLMIIAAGNEGNWGTGPTGGPQTTFVDVMVPPGGIAGQSVTFDAAGGQQFTATIPPGVEPGQVFRAAVPVSASVQIRPSHVASPDVAFAETISARPTQTEPVAKDLEGLPVAKAV
jgi:hypothetical protein